MAPGSRRSTPSICAAAVVVCAVASCGPGPLDPTTTGGQLLPGTQGVEYLGGRPFSISPDGRWMLFSKLPDDARPAGSEDLEQLTLRQLESFVLYDLEQREGTPVGVSDGVRDLAAAGGAVLVDGGCWVPDEDAVVVGNEFGRYLGVRPIVPQPRWEAIASEPFAFRDRCRHEDGSRPEPGTVGPFHIAHAGGRLIIIVAADDPHRVFAVHRAPRFPGMGVHLGNLRLTADGWRLAYTVTPHLGSFVGNARGFVVSYDAPPERPTVLGSPVHAIEWGPDGSTVYADVERNGQPGIYRWRLPRHGKAQRLPVALRVGSREEWRGQAESRSVSRSVSQSESRLGWGEADSR